MIVGSVGKDIFQESAEKSGESRKDGGMSANKKASHLRMVVKNYSSDISTFAQESAEKSGESREICLPTLPTRILKPGQPVTLAQRVRGVRHDAPKLHVLMGEKGDPGYNSGNQIKGGSAAGNSLPRGTQTQEVRDA